MSGIVRDPDKVPAGTVRLECFRCNHQHPIADLDWLGDPLRCSACYEVGLIPRRQDRIADRYPGKLGERFTTVPLALLDSDNGLDLTPAERLVLIVLNSFRWRRDDLVYPSQERIADMTGLSRRTVQRTLDRLAADGLIAYWRERHGSFPRNVYEIRPVFDALAFGAKRPLPML